MNHIDFLHIYRHVDFNDDRRRFQDHIPAGNRQGRLAHHLRLHAGRLLVEWGNRLMPEQEDARPAQPLAYKR
jgi:hypothetical protein